MGEQIASEKRRDPLDILCPISFRRARDAAIVDIHLIAASSPGLGIDLVLG
jgi:hypothetical protein